MIEKKVYMKTNRCYTHAMYILYISMLKTDESTENAFPVNIIFKLRYYDTKQGKYPNLNNRHMKIIFCWDLELVDFFLVWRSLA